MIAIEQALESWSVNVKNDAPVYNQSWTYNCGDRVVLGKRVYQCVADGVSGVDPTINSGKWVLWAVNNPDRALDMQADTATVCTPVTSTDGTAEMVATFTVPAEADGMIMAGVIGTSAEITQLDASGRIVAGTETEIPLVYNGEPLIYNGEIIIAGYNLAPYTVVGSEAYIPISHDASTVSIRIYPASGISAIGSLVVGHGVNIGCAQSGASQEYAADIARSSGPSGVVDMEPRSVVMAMHVSAHIDRSDYYRVRDYMRRRFGKPMGFSAYDDEKEGGFVAVGYASSASFSLEEQGGVARYKIEEVH